MSQMQIKKEKLPNCTVAEDKKLLDLVYINREALLFDSSSNKNASELKQTVSNLDNYCLN